MNGHIPQRRSVLLSGLALAAAAKIGLGGGAAAAAPAPDAPLKVRVTIDNKSYEFDETKGRDLGDYEGPGFVQRCIMVTVPDLPLSVFMRPDRNSQRVEVVIELGSMWSGPPQPLGAYVAEIERGATPLARIEVPRHFWLSRWRWQSAPRPVIAKAAPLVASGLVPPYVSLSGEAPERQPQRAQGNGQGQRQRQEQGKDQGQGQGQGRGQAQERFPDERTYSIMGLANLTAYMPTTGDRREIGPVTEPQATWIGTGGGEGIEDLLAQAEASGTIPWHMRDEKTGAPFDFNQYPKGGWTRDEPHLCNPYVATIKSPVTPDVAHHPSLTYVPFLLTGDPYYLEALQLAMTWCIGDVAPEYRLQDKCILFHSQTRGYAWCLRDAAQLAKVTPVKVPSWLKPRTYWEHILENNRAWFEETYVHQQDPPFRVFRAATKIRNGEDDVGVGGIPRIDPFEEEYLAFILGWVVLMGFPSWREAFTWKVGATIARTNGKSGWGRAYAVPYLFCLSRGHSAPWAASWKEAWDINVQIQKWVINDPNHFEERNTGYLCYTRAVLALAARADVQDAKDCYSWADNVIRLERHNRIPNQWGVSA